MNEGSMSDLLQKGKTPEAWSAELEEHGVHVSPRLIRSTARKTGQFYQLGRLMLLTPTQIERLLEPAGDFGGAEILGQANYPTYANYCWLGSDP